MSLPVRNISDRAFVADEVLRPGVRKVLVEDAVESPRLVLVPVDAVFDMLRGVAGEVIRLALHWAHAGVQEEEPAGHLIQSQISIEV